MAKGLRKMKVTMKGDYLFIETEDDLSSLPYLSKADSGYKCFWHFIRDFSQVCKFPLTNELKEQVREKVDGIKDAKAFLKNEVDVAEYSKYFNKNLEQYQFQARGVEFVVQQKSVLLADDVGLGKSIVALTVMLHLIETQNLMKFLIVVPASLRIQWLSECRRFLNRKMFPDLSIGLNNKSAKERKFIYRSFKETTDPAMLISSYDMIRRDKDKLKDLEVDMIVLDEATKIKTRKTKINKAVRNLFYDAEYKLCMTATPIENGLEDLYCICEFLDKRKLHNKRYFHKRYCIIENQRLWHRNITIEKIVGYKNIKDVREKLAGMYIRRTVESVELELPDIIKQNIILDLKDKQFAMYQEIIGNIVGDMTRDDLLAQMIYLQEVCDSTELLDKDIKSSSKADEVKRLLADDLKYSKVILMTRFKKFAKVLKRELSKQKPLLITGDVGMTDRGYIISQFNSETKSRILIGTEAIQEGLNLQVASVLINLDLPFNPSALQQRIGRLRRLGSEHKTIRMINLITKDTIEERVLEILYRKGKLFEEMFVRDKAVKIGSLLGMNTQELRDMMGKD